VSIYLTLDQEDDLTGYIGCEIADPLCIA